MLDEADEILSMGFAQALKDILEYIPRSAQTMLFSATLPKSIHSIAKVALKNPENIFLNVRTDTDHNDTSSSQN